MTLDEYIYAVDAFLYTLEQEMPAVADEIALNALALVKNRIVDQGQGIKGAHYSTHPMLATKDQFIVESAFKQTQIESTRLSRDDKGKVKRKKDGSLVRKGSTKQKRGLWIKFPKASKAVPVMVLEQGYKEFREIQGRQGNVVDGSYTGKMWQGTTIVARISNRKNVWASVIGGNNQEAQNKLAWMTDKYGPFLTVFPEEEQMLATVYNARLQSLLNRYFI